MLNITTSPDISVLDFGIEYDISGAVPKITITNLSTGPDLASCRWWYVIQTPSGTYIHNGNSATPDRIGVWTPITVPDTWPQFNSQIEFSPAAPYKATLFVKDGANNVFSLEKKVTIAAPNGNNCNSGNNWGVAEVTLEVQCNNAKIFGSDHTNYTYQTKLGSSSSSKWTLAYPMDANNNIPAPRTVTNSPNVLFPVGFNSEGYQINFGTIATYDFGDFVTIKLQYKFRDTFAVLCNIDLCSLVCEIQKLYAKLNHHCGITEENELKDKLLKINTLLNLIFINIQQPLCKSINITNAIKQIEEIGGFSCNCCSGGVNALNTVGGIESCCPITADVIDDATGNIPTECPNSFFPARVLGTDGETVIGVANSAADMIAIINSDSGWAVYGVAFSLGNCKVGWYLSNPVSIPPIIEIIKGTGEIVPPTVIVGDLVIKGTDDPPVGCPSGNPYPLRVYKPDGVTIIGIATNIADVVSLLNTDPDWSAFGTASVQDTCHVQWNLIDGTVIPPDIETDTDDGCSNGTNLYIVKVKDVCSPSIPVSIGDFPMNGWVDFGLGAGPEYIGYVADMVAYVAALNAHPSKPAVVHFSTGPIPTAGEVWVTVDDCVVYPGTVILTGDKNSDAFLLFGASHGTMTPAIAIPTTGGMEALGLRSNSVLGEIPPGIATDEVPWHTIVIGTVLITACGNTGNVYFWNITNPKMPAFIRRIALTDPSGNSFTGIPTMTGTGGVTGVPSVFSLYFPTDYHNMNLREIYVCEAITGSIWKLDMYDSVGVIAAFFDQRLEGKCPRVIIGNILYYTQDGSLETDTGVVSGVTIGDIVKLNLGTFSAGGISTQNIFVGSIEYVWAASFDGVDTIWFVSNQGGVARYQLSTGTVLNVYLNALGIGKFMTLKGWAKFFNNFLYCCSLGGWTPLGVNKGTLMLHIPSLPLSAVVMFQSEPTGDPSSLFAYSIIPLGNCLMLVCGDGGGNVGNRGSVLLYKSDGTFLSRIMLPTGVNVYNVAAIPGIGVYTPNSFV